MSEVEQLFYRLQKETGGSAQWSQLDPMLQHQFVQSVNFILQVTRL